MLDCCWGLACQGVEQVGGRHCRAQKRDADCGPRGPRALYEVYAHMSAQSSFARTTPDVLIQPRIALLTRVVISVSLPRNASLAHCVCTHSANGAILPVLRSLCPVQNAMRTDPLDVTNERPTCTVFPTLQLSDLPADPARAPPPSPHALLSFNPPR